MTVPTLNPATTVAVHQNKSPKTVQVIELSKIELAQFPVLSIAHPIKALLHYELFYAKYGRYFETVAEQKLFHIKNYCRMYKCKLSGENFGSNNKTTFEGYIIEVFVNSSRHSLYAISNADKTKVNELLLHQQDTAGAQNADSDYRVTTKYIAQLVTKN